jgi:hypothetical protein
MMLKIIILGIVFIGGMFLMGKVFPDRADLLLVFFSGFLGIYFVLLYFEIRSRVRKSLAQKTIRWSGFHLTFWVGIYWGALNCFSKGFYKWFTDPWNITNLIFGLVSPGVLLGVLGMAITEFILIGVFKYRERQ